MVNIPRIRKYIIYNMSFMRLVFGVTIDQLRHARNFFSSDLNFTLPKVIGADLRLEPIGIASGIATEIPTKFRAVRNNYAVN